MKYLADLVSADTLLLPGERAIYVGALTALGSAHVPPVALKRFVPDIMKGLVRFIAPSENEAECDRDCESASGSGHASRTEWTPRVVALSAADSLLRNYPHLLLSPAAYLQVPRLLSEILASLICEECNYRELAYSAIAAFANAVEVLDSSLETDAMTSRGREVEMRKEIAQVCVSWLDEQERRARLRNSPSTSTSAANANVSFVFADYAPSIPTPVSSTAITENQQDQLEERATTPNADAEAARALVLAGTLALLCGPQLFIVPGALRAVVKCIERAGSGSPPYPTLTGAISSADKGKNVVRILSVLRSSAWRCLVGAWAQMKLFPLLWNDNWDERREIEEKTKKAWMVVKQETRGDVGIVLVAALLDSCSLSSASSLHALDETGNWRILEAARLVGELTEGKGRKGARAILGALVSSQEKDEGATSDDTREMGKAAIVPIWLFDASLIQLTTTMAFSSTSSILGCASLSQILAYRSLDPRATIRSLTEDELKTEGVWPGLVKAFVGVTDVGASGRVEVRYPFVPLVRYTDIVIYRG